ncbi:MAG: DUF1566 domain-containing protein [Steroidobacteraceae bacterium]
MRPGSLFVALAIGYCTCASSGEQTCSGAPTRNASDFIFVAGGSQVLDKTSGLIWMRCLEGQSWTGDNCVADDPNAVNPGPNISFAEAKVLAASRTTDEESWRLPSKSELLTLRESRCYNPSFSLIVFPTRPAWSSDGFFWTSTPEAEGVALVSAIGTSDAWSSTDESNIYHVRLVRNMPKPGE